MISYILTASLVILCLLVAALGAWDTARHRQARDQSSQRCESE